MDAYKLAATPGKLDSFDGSMEELRADYVQIQTAYTAAIREINARLQTLNQDFSLQNRHNPIQLIESRV